MSRVRRNRQAWTNAALVVGLLVVTALVVAAFRAGSLAGVALPPPAALPSSPTWTTPARPQLGQVVSELKDAGKPVDIVVIGDSTSANARTNWVYLLGEWIGREYDRPVTITPWSPDARPPQYVNDVRPHRGGSGAPVHIWASGASGKGVEYAVANLDELLPQPARDAAWVIVNHGHNALPDTLSGQVLDLLDGIEARAPSAVKTVILQNPERPGSANDAGSTSNVRVLADSVSYNGYGTIDVMSAFTSREDYAPLLDGAIHPNAQGYRLWARTVEAALTKAG